jgi:3-oxoacyl-[acyl-carrier protein] reductase
MKCSKKVIITGTSKGIGLEICKNFLNQNYEVLSISRTIPPIYNKNLFHLKINLSKRKELEKFKKKIINFKTNHLISNAGDLGEIGSINKINVKKWEESFFLNLFSHIYITKYCLPNILKKKGKIIFLAGGGSANSFPNFSAYSVAKTALVRFCENLADENNGKIITNIISPGAINTGLLEKSLRHGHTVNQNKIISTEKCIELINFLIKNNKNFYNGKFIHALDNYKQFNEFNTDNKFLLRRVENRSL